MNGLQKWVKTAAYYGARTVTCKKKNAWVNYDDRNYKIGKSYLHTPFNEKEIPILFYSIPGVI